MDDDDTSSLNPALLLSSSGSQHQHHTQLRDRSDSSGSESPPQVIPLEDPLVAKEPATLRSSSSPPSPPGSSFFGELKQEATYRLATRAGWKNTVFTLFPVLTWVPEYQISSNLRGDLMAGLTVGVMIVPQGMGYAGVAGLPPVYGLYTSLLPIFVYSMLGTSRQLSVGAVAVMSLLVGSTLPQLVTDPTDVADYVRLAAVLALMVGVINATMGVLRLGFLVSLLSPAVVSGFMSASSIIILCTQLKDAFGVSISRTNLFYLNLYWVSQQLWTASYIAVLFCLCSLIFLDVRPPHPPIATP